MGAMKLLHTLNYSKFKILTFGISPMVMVKRKHKKKKRIHIRNKNLRKKNDKQNIFINKIKYK